MNEITVIGSIAAICTTIAFIPQTIKVVKTKHTKDLSLKMYLIFEVGVIAWLIYGILIQSPPVLYSNIIILILSTIILIYKLKYK
ncbi:SemiSWEET family sugar transporter [Patescibacteria group bacterium]